MAAAAQLEKESKKSKKDKKKKTAIEETSSTAPDVVSASGTSAGFCPTYFLS